MIVDLLCDVRKEFGYESSFPPTAPEAGPGPTSRVVAASPVRSEINPYD